MTKFVRSFMFVLIAMSFMLAACGGAAAATQAPVVEPTIAPVEPIAAPTDVPTEAPAEDPLAMHAPDAVSGDIVTAGSDRKSVV